MIRILGLAFALGLAGCSGDSADAPPAPEPSPGTPAAGSAAPAAAPATADTASAYTACAACHLPTGDGVPGAFPPIRNRTAAIARLEGGRDYLITVVAYGLMGSISVNGQTYAGVMPGHAGAMDNAQIAAAVNHTIFALSDSPPADIQPITADEVEAQRAAIAAPNPSSAYGLRQALVEQHGDAWPQ